MFRKKNNYGRCGVYSYDMTKKVDWFWKALTNYFVLPITDDKGAILENTPDVEGAKCDTDMLWRDIRLPKPNVETL